MDVLREPVENFIKMMAICDSLARTETKYITGDLDRNIRLWESTT